MDDSFSIDPNDDHQALQKHKDSIDQIFPIEMSLSADSKNPTEEGIKKGNDDDDEIPQQY